jgi:hypothetical protein
METAALSTPANTAPYLTPEQRPTAGIEASFAQAAAQDSQAIPPPLLPPQSQTTSAVHQPGRSGTVVAIEPVVPAANAQRDMRTVEEVESLTHSRRTGSAATHQSEPFLTRSVTVVNGGDGASMAAAAAAAGKKPLVPYPNPINEPERVGMPGGAAIFLGPCRICGYVGMTIPVKHRGKHSWKWCACMTVTVLPLLACLCWIPMCNKNCVDVQHRCPCCGALYRLQKGGTSGRCC